MNNSRATQPLQNPLVTKLTNAKNHIQLSAWLPPQTGVIPRIRIGQEVDKYIMGYTPNSRFTDSCYCRCPAVAYNACCTGIHPALPG